ncbi:MAG: UTP--glucose-1-phosphate uridylyltransferase [Armatimonadia bacterium]
MSKLTAVIPAAGMGTRLFPLTYAVPKELLPLGPKPAIQLVVEELLHAGVKDFVIVIGKKKDAIAEHFMALRATDPMFGEKDVRIQFASQPHPKGLGDAVLCAECAVQGPFVVALGDAVIYGKKFGDLMRRMLAVHAETQAVATIAAQQVPLEDTSRYGIIAPGEAGPEGSIRILDLVEKPGPEKAPSTLAICARYVLSPRVFEILRTIEPGHGGEVQLTDALQVLIRDDKAYAVPLAEDEERWDVGSLKGYGKATLKAWAALGE